MALIASLLAMDKVDGPGCLLCLSAGLYLRQGIYSMIFKDLEIGDLHG